ncbi:MAG: hypothetical protein E7172_04970 [Firmicutes bacterium]|nr:hypothetical protein [Bacillota bacterium]
MNYNQHLNYFTNVTISFKELKKTINEKFKPNDLNKDLFFLLKTFNYSDKLLKKVILNESGFYFDLSNLITELCRYFNFENDQHLIENLNQLEHKLVTNEITSIINQSKIINNLRKNNFNTNLSKNEYFKTLLLTQVRLFKDLLKDNLKYKKINDYVISQEKLDLLIVDTVIKYFEYMKLKKMKFNQSRFISYLINYINNNIHLLSENFSFDKYSIQKVYNFLYFQTKIKFPKDIHNIEQFDYSFLELTTLNKDMLFTKIINISKKGNNDEKLNELFQRKINLYKSLKILKIKIGIDKFNGYIGFVLPNKIVILDKLFDNIKEGILAQNNAIYVVKEEDFERLTKMSKTEVIEYIKTDFLQAARIIHNQNFEERIRKIYNN